jgi:hypothetical protein
VATPAGHEVNFGVAGYKYLEPGDTSISIHGLKVGGGYTGTRSLNSGQHWFLQADAQGRFGSTTYDGWCSPFLITPDRTSPNGYALDIAGAKYQMTRHWSVEPGYIHWNVSASPVNDETATLTVNTITVRQQLGAYEPLNRTNEFVLKLGFHF